MASSKAMARLPSLGLGLWKAKPGEVGSAVIEAVKAGYRLLDGAAAYGNEQEVGAALKTCFEEGLVARSDLCVVSKVFNSMHVWKDDTSRPETALRTTLADLQLSQLDLYLMHWPLAFEKIDFPKAELRGPDGTPNPKLVMEMEFLETWRAMIGLKKAGLCRMIGVCNFTAAQLQELQSAFPDDPPEVLQVELHPYLAQPELVAYCHAHDITVMAYSPLGSPDSYSGSSFPAVGTEPFQCQEGGTPLLQNACVQRVAARRGVTAGQVLLAWSATCGCVPLPKSVRPERIRENLAALDVKLEKEDMDELAALDCGFRYGIGYMLGHYDCPNSPWCK